MQTRKESFIEVCINTFSGLFVGFLANSLILPLYGFPFEFGTMIELTFIFTGISICRSYFWRRYYNKKIIDKWKNRHEHD